MRNRPLVLACLLCLSLVAPFAVAADTQYSLSVADSVDTPTRTVTLEGEQFQVSAIGRVSPGEQLRFSVDAPAGVDYSVYLYDDNRNIVDNVRLTGNDSASFPTSGYEPGSYMLAVDGPDGNFREVHPVIFEAYDLSIDGPNTVEPGEEVTYTITLSPVDGTDENVSRVELVTSHDGEDDQLTATKESAGTYTVTTTFEEVGDYDLYMNVRGTDSVEGRKELLGASDAGIVSVRDSTPTPSPTPTDSHSSSDTGGTGSTPTATPTDKPTVTSTASPTATGTMTPTAVSSPETTPDTDDTTATPTPSNVVTPAPTGSQPSTRTDAPGSLGLGVTIVALVAAAVLLTKR